MRLLPHEKGETDCIRYLIEKKYVAENKLTYYLSQKFGLPSINLTKFDIAPDVVKVLTRELVRKYQAIPIQMNKGTLVVAMWNPINTSALGKPQIRGQNDRRAGS